MSEDREQCGQGMSNQGCVLIRVSLSVWPMSVWIQMSNEAESCVLGGGHLLWLVGDSKKNLGKEYWRNVTCPDEDYMMLVCTFGDWCDKMFTMEEIRCCSGTYPSGLDPSELKEGIRRLWQGVLWNYRHNALINIAAVIHLRGGKLLPPYFQSGRSVSPIGRASTRPTSEAAMCQMRDWVALGSIASLLSYYNLSNLKP